MDWTERGVNAGRMYENLIQPPGEEVCFSLEREAEGLCQGSHRQGKKHAPTVLIHLPACLQTQQFGFFFFNAQLSVHIKKLMSC